MTEGRRRSKDSELSPGKRGKRNTSKNNRVKYRERIGRGLEGPGEGRELWSERVQGSEAEEKG